MVHIEEISGGRYVDKDTGRIMSLETALKRCCQSWIRYDRQEYLMRRVFGHESKEDIQGIKPRQEPRGNIDTMESEYKGQVLDGLIWQWEDENGELVISSAKENRRRIAEQILKRRFKRSKDKISFDIPEKLKPNERKICGAILNKEHINLKTGLVRYGNGYPMDTKAIAKLAGIENIKTAQRALKGLIEKGIMTRQEKNNKSMYFLNKQRYIVDNTNKEKSTHPLVHQESSNGGTSRGIFQDQQSIL